MTKYSRKPAGIALALTLGLGFSALAATGQFRSPDALHQSVGQLERQIASGHGDARTWSAYGDALAARHRYAHAAQAYDRALELHPGENEIAALRFNEGLCLGQAGNADHFFAFFSHLTTIDPKQAVDLLERAELASLHQDPRWSSAATTARAQAAD